MTIPTDIGFGAPRIGREDGGCQINAALGIAGGSEEGQLPIEGVTRAGVGDVEPVPDDGPPAW